MGVNKQQALLAAAVACLVAAAGSASFSKQAQAAGDKVPCYGINKCKGMGDCGGKDHSCAGKNECSGKGSIMLDKDTCLKIQGGRLTAEKE